MSDFVDSLWVQILPQWLAGGEEDPRVAFLKLVVVGVVAPGVGRAEEVDNADEVAPPDAGVGVRDVGVALPDVGVGVVVGGNGVVGVGVVEIAVSDRIVSRC
jgi:hypothetical protein